MIKVFSLLRRREDWSREEFHRWWLEEHVPYARKLPGLRRYRVCLTKGSTTHEGREPFDGVAELWFDSREALEAAWSSPVGREAVNHSRANVSDRVVLITEEHEIL
ncbi:MAG TPA: EthD family reductase [Thermodesulfobacteriota bacterium]|nr:EthD family reductase [Thermodesulfobacteriota bacterium]